MEAGLDTFFVSLTFEDYELAETRRCSGADAAWKLSFNLTRSSERPRASRESSFADAADVVDPRRELANDARVTALEFGATTAKLANPGNVPSSSTRRGRPARRRGAVRGEIDVYGPQCEPRRVSRRGVDEMASLLELGLRAGVDWLDGDGALSQKQLKRLRRMAERGARPLIRRVAPPARRDDVLRSAEALLNKCAKRSSGDAVKLVVDAAQVTAPRAR